jgi:hypothetical protein
MASSTRNTILVVARALDESELWCSTCSTVPEKILPEPRNTREEIGSNSLTGKLLDGRDSIAPRGASAAYAEIAVMKSAIEQTERTSSLTVRKAAL